MSLFCNSGCLKNTHSQIYEIETCKRKLFLANVVILHPLEKHRFSDVFKGKKMKIS